MDGWMGQKVDEKDDDYEDNDNDEGDGDDDVNNDDEGKAWYVGLG